MIVGIDHIAIAVSDAQKAIEKFCQDLEFELLGVEDVATMSTRTAFFPMKGQVKIELISPIDMRGPVSTFLEKKGEGLHHLCFETNDIISDVKRLQDLGYEFTSDKPTSGAHGHQVIFVHPKSVHGVLIELVEKSS